MASSTTSGVYINVIEDVINKVRDEFINNGGPGEDVITELQGLWELKMMQAGAILGPIDRSANQKAAACGGPITPNPVHDLNVPYEGTEEYETPTADLLFPPTPLQTPMQTPLPGTVQTPLPGMAQTPLPGMAQTPLTGGDGSSMYNIPTGGTPITPNEFSSTIENGGVAGTRAGLGRPSSYMQPPSSWLNQRHPLDVNVAYVEGREEGERGPPNQPTTQDFFATPAGKRKREDFRPPNQAGRHNIPQQDGAGDFQLEVLKADATLLDGKVEGSGQKVFVQGGKSSSSRIPQLDGPIPDTYDDEDELSTPNGNVSLIYNYQGGAVNEDYNTVNTPMPNDLQAPTPPVPPNDNDDDDDDDDDEPLNEDDDDDLDDVENGEDLNTTHLVLAQFDKVTRTKSRWKCTLKNGIMHINSKDILFNKATGEFDF